MLNLSHISKSYDSKPLLEDISFDVQRGETVCLLGASGSGKSTLLRMIAGLEFPENGHISFNGLDLTPVPPHARDFGLVFQDYGLFPHLNIFDNVAFGLKMKSVSRDEIQRRVTEALEMVNLKGFERRKTTDLSGGESQRVALARALAPRPRLLMFDEPLGALDRAMKEDLLNELRALLRRMDIPAIYVTHDQEEAFAIADRILILHDGQIVCEGTPTEVVNRPCSAWTAKFLGLGNIIEGVALDENRVQTDYGIFTVGNLSKGENVHLLARPREALPRVYRGVEEKTNLIKGKVADVSFQKDGYRVVFESGLFILMKNPPKIGQVVSAPIAVEKLESEVSRLQTAQRQDALESVIVVKKNPAGETTWQYDGAILRRDENMLIVEARFDRDDLPFMGVVLKRGDRFVETYYFDKWYNVFEIYDRDDNQFKGRYCNVASPAVLSDRVLTYVDLGLDLWVGANGEQAVLDEDEFEEMNLDSETRTQALKALEELKENFRSR